MTHMARQVLLITGGNDGYPKYDPLDTTELLVPGSGSWLLVTDLLPRPMFECGHSGQHCVPHRWVQWDEEDLC